MKSENDIFFTEIREQRKEMNEGFNRIYDALEDHKKQTIALYNKHDEQIVDLMGTKAIMIGASKAIAIIVAGVLFIKTMIS